MKDKNSNKEQWQKLENSNKYGRVGDFNTYQKQTYPENKKSVRSWLKN